MVYLQTENCDSGQRKETESISVLSRSSRRHLVEEADRLHSGQKGKNLEVQLPLKLEFRRGREAEAISALQQSSCFLRVKECLCVACDLREIKKLAW